MELKGFHILPVLVMYESNEGSHLVVCDLGEANVQTLSLRMNEDQTASDRSKGTHPGEPLAKYLIEVIFVDGVEESDLRRIVCLYGRGEYLVESFARCDLHVVLAASSLRWQWSE